MVRKRPALQGGDLYDLAESGMVRVSISSPAMAWHSVSNAIRAISFSRTNLIEAVGSRSDPKTKWPGIARTRS